MMRARFRAFSLIEVVIVAGVIATLTAVAVPNLVRARLSANEGQAASNLETIMAAASTYQSVKNILPANMSDLAAEGYLPDTALACASEPCLKSGYRYSISGTGQVGDFFAFTIPQTINITGIRAFCADSDGVIRVNPAGTAPASRANCHSWPPS